jgi:poly(3-hydroxybutyrate) depolymerase
MGTWVKYPNTTMTTNVGGYYLYTPTGANSSTACIIALHGLGEQGSGSSTDLGLLETEGLSEIIHSNMGTGFEFPYDSLVVFPQYTGGAPTLFRVQGIIDYVKANLTFDQNKLHLTGLSLGAQGVTNWWDIGDLTDIASCSVLSTPSTYYENGANNCVAADMPIWFIHGDADENPFCPPTNSTRWVNGFVDNGWAGLNGLGITPATKLTLVAGGSHNVYNTVYNWNNWTDGGQTLIQWHLTNSRASGILVHDFRFKKSGVLNKILLYSDNTYTQQRVTGNSWADVTQESFSVRWDNAGNKYRFVFTGSTYEKYQFTNNTWTLI